MFAPSGCLVEPVLSQVELLEDIFLNCVWLHRHQTILEQLAQMEKKSLEFVGIEPRTPGHQLTVLTTRSPPRPIFSFHLAATAWSHDPKHTFYQVVPFCNFNCNPSLGAEVSSLHYISALEVTFHELIINYWEISAGCCLARFSRTHWLELPWIPKRIF